MRSMKGRRTAATRSTTVTRLYAVGIRQMRAAGYGYMKIAQELGISENTVKSFCRRKGLSAGKIKAAVPSADGDKGICPCCGADVGRILRTFKIKMNVEVTNNGKDDF